MDEKEKGMIEYRLNMFTRLKMVLRADYVRLKRTSVGDEDAEKLSKRIILVLDGS